MYTYKIMELDNRFFVVEFKDNELHSVQFWNDSKEECEKFLASFLED
jgi:hypothetical protein